jgi:ATP-binding cassette subfamily B protein
LENGRIVQRGTHQELLEQDGLYRRIYDLQTRIEVEVEKEVGGANGNRPEALAVELPEAVAAE